MKKINHEPPLSLTGQLEPHEPKSFTRGARREDHGGHGEIETVSVTFFSGGRPGVTPGGFFIGAIYGVEGFQGTLWVFSLCHLFGVKWYQLRIHTFFSLYIA
jgi:hypothetical protein